MFMIGGPGETRTEDTYSSEWFRWSIRKRESRHSKLTAPQVKKDDPETVSSNVWKRVLPRSLVPG